MNLPESLQQGEKGVTKSQRMQNLWLESRESREGNVARLQTVLQAGVDVDGANEYGVTALHLAAWYGQASCCQMLLQWGADASVTANGVTPLIAARANGHDAIIELLTTHAAGMAATPLNQLDDDPMMQYQPPLALEATPSFTRLIDQDLDHPGAGSFYIDDGLSHFEIEALISLWKRLPREPYSDLYQLYKGEVERSYYWDATGWVRRILSSIIDRAQSSGGVGDGTLMGAGESLPYFRILHYKSQGAYVGVHLDVAKKEAVAAPGSKKRSSRLTFLLYLSGDEADGEGGEGGETVLHQSEAPGSKELARVAPKRGRMLVFPHNCPHSGLAVQNPPKILIRGEFL